MAHRLAWLLAACALGCTGYAAQPSHSASEDDVFSLEKQVHSGDRSAIRILLSLDVDGAAAEDVAVVMGQLILADPRVFLEEMLTDRRAECCLNSFLGALGDPFVDRLREQIDELTKRRNALRAVGDAPLQQFRDRCVTILDEQTRTIESLLRQDVTVQP